jgi:hypothetical protein
LLSIYPLHKETKVRENWKDGREISLEKVIERGRKAQSTRKVLERPARKVSGRNVKKGH